MSFEVLIIFRIECAAVIKPPHSVVNNQKYRFPPSVYRSRWVTISLPSTSAMVLYSVTIMAKVGGIFHSLGGQIHPVDQCSYIVFNGHAQDVAHFHTAAVPLLLHAGLIVVELLGMIANSRDGCICCVQVVRPLQPARVIRLPFCGASVPPEFRDTSSQYQRRSSFQYCTGSRSDPRLPSDRERN